MLSGWIKQNGDVLKVQRRNESEIVVRISFFLSKWEWSESVKVEMKVKVAGVQMNCIGGQLNPRVVSLD